MPNLFFADLVREMCQEGGAGPLTPTGAVPGHRRFAEAVPANTPFHYAIAGIAHPAQWEVGQGRIDVEGRLVREHVATSSDDGAPVDFAPGLKTIALTVGAEWYGGIAPALEGKQPLSTLHDPAATGAMGDTLTVRRGAGWVNIPLATLPYLSAGGQHGLSGALAGVNGTAGAPAISFAGDPDTGIFTPSGNQWAIATAGVERLRVRAAGEVGIGIDPSARFHVRSAASDTMALIARLETMNVAGNDYAGLFVSADPTTNMIQLASTGSQAGGFSLLSGATERMRIEVGGALRPGTDNSQTLGAASFRWSVVYAGTGTINTSDAEEKQWIAAGLSAPEMAAARRITAEIGSFRWLAAIAEKGDAARVHVGVRAQAVWAIMADEGLIDPLNEGAPPSSRYGFLCHDAWEGDAAAGVAGGSRFGIREGQLTLFLIAAQEARIAALEAAA